VKYQAVKNKLRYFKRLILGSPTQLNTMHEPSELKFILRYLSENDTVYDVGANIGLWTYFLAKSKLNLNVISFEPNPNIWPSLEKNLVDVNNVRIEKIGVGNANSTADFYVHPSHGRSSFSKSPENAGCKVVSSVISTLDSFVLKEENRVLPALIKVDVEGLEPDVWEGMQSLLLKNKPKVLVFEIEDRHLQPRGYSAQYLAKNIVNAGYSCFVHDVDMINIDVDRFEFPPQKPNGGNRYINNFIFVDSSLLDDT
jgi:FkbM family methyltransferase